MKVLLLSNTAGQGHRATAGALTEVFTRMGAECRELDSYAYISPVLYQTIARGYLIATAAMPTAYGRAYRFAEKTDRADRRHTISGIVNSVMSLKLQKYFHEEFDPDVIVCTHIFSAQIMNEMKQSGQIRQPVIGIVTDYTIHPFWQDLGFIDYFVTAGELLTYQAVKKGISKEKILPFGIPIRQKFGHRVEKGEACDALGIDREKFTLLLMSGSMGYGDIAGTLKKIDALDDDFQILAVCGNNRRAKSKIDRLITKKRVFSYGFVDNVDLMMDAADCIVTKPGGLTTSEALAKGLPILMINPIPGQEERNVEFMLNNGLAVNVTATCPIDEALYQLFRYPEKLKNMERNIRIVGKPNAAENLCEFVMKLGK